MNQDESNRMNQQAALSSNLVTRLRKWVSWGYHGHTLCGEAAEEIERAGRIMRRAISWLQIKEAAFASHKGPAIIEEMQRFVEGFPDETGDRRAVLHDVYRSLCIGWDNRTLPASVISADQFTAMREALEIPFPGYAKPGMPPVEASAETDGVLPDARLIRSALFQQFLRQGFWHAHHVDLVWRYNGQDVREEADWLKDVWYALRRPSSAENLQQRYARLREAAIIACSEMGCYCKGEHQTTPPEMRSALCKLGDLVGSPEEAEAERSIARADEPCNFEFRISPPENRCLNCGWLVCNHQHSPEKASGCTDCLEAPGVDGKIVHKAGCSATYVKVSCREPGSAVRVGERSGGTLPPLATPTITALITGMLRHLDHGGWIEPGSYFHATIRSLKASQTPEQRRAAIDAAALADAHRMYEAEHGEPFPENGSALQQEKS